MIFAKFCRQLCTKITHRNVQTVLLLFSLLQPATKIIRCLADPNSLGCDLVKKIKHQTHKIDASFRIILFAVRKVVLFRRGLIQDTKQVQIVSQNGSEVHLHFILSFIRAHSNAWQNPKKSWRLLPLRLQLMIQQKFVFFHIISSFCKSSSTRISLEQLVAPDFIRSHPTVSPNSAHK